VRRARVLFADLLEALAAFDPALIPGDECVVLAEELARVAKAAETACARAAARAIECGHRGGEGDASAFEWLARVCGTTTTAARRKVATISAAGECGATRAALVAGDVSLEQAAEVVSVPEHEAELLALAKSTGLGPVRDRARKRRCEAIPAEELHARQHAAREFRQWRDELGMIRFRGALPPEVGVPITNRIDAETDRQSRAARPAHCDDPRVALAADAFVALVNGACAAAGKAKGADLVLVCDLNAYRRGHTHDGEPCHIVGGGPIPVAVARELARDAFLKVVLHDGVTVHTVAHFGRHRPAHLETALSLGAPPDFEGVTCAERGCDRRYGLEWDHVDPVANGGETSIANLKPECKPHHWDKPNATATPDCSEPDDPDRRNRVGQSRTQRGRNTSSIWWKTTCTGCPISIVAGSISLIAPSALATRLPAKRIEGSSSSSTMTAL